MKIKTLKLRKEIFGSTLFASHTGKRVYLNKGETEILIEGKTAKDVLLQDLGMEGDIRISSPSSLPDNNFSAPDTIFLEVTRACNLRCVHCFNNSGVRLGDELSSSDHLRIIRDLASCGVQEIRFTGGEPTLLPDLRELMSVASDFGMRISMGTNGIVTNPQKIQSISSFLHLAVISIDGTKAIHDAIRGKRSFDQTMEGLQTFRSLGVEVRVNTVVMKSNMDDVVSLVEILYGHDLPVFIRRLIPSGRATEMFDEMLTVGDYEDLEARLAQYIDDPRGLIRGHYLREKEVEPRIPLPFPRSGCSAGHRGMVILPNGKVQTCGFLGPLGEKSVGDVSCEVFEVIWKRLISSSHIDTLRAHLPTYNKTACGPCTNCLAIGLAHKEN